ncbi:uncharacterized protein BDFB_009489, partial [Asbolus verrucosus]
MADGQEPASVSSTPPAEQIDQSSLAWKIFMAFVNDGEIAATEEELLAYAIKEFDIDLAKLPTFLVESLPTILVAFMNMWSGWHFKGEFLAGKFKTEHYFNRFKKFMAHKVRVTINGQFNAAVKAVGDLQDFRYKSAMKSTGRPVGFNDRRHNNPEFSPYAILIQCPPHMLNTIVFSNSGEDVIMKQHLGASWRDLSTIQLVNWPHVEVSFRTQDLCFVRRQATEFVRYLNFLPHECRKTNHSIIEHVETLRNYDRQKVCYTYRFLQEYIQEYVQALKTIKDITGGKLEEVLTILTQFLEDVKFINVNGSMATNTVVLFRLSPMPFIRNKKLVKTTDKDEEARVGYCEIITPKIELVMLYFRAQQKDVPYYSFELTEKIRSSANSSDLNNILPYIAYKCTFCRVEFDTGNAKKSMMEHLKNQHKMEQHVRCTFCKKQFDVVNLATYRWRHKCVSSTVPILAKVTI